MAEIEPFPDFVGEQAQGASINAIPGSSKGPKGMVSLAAVGWADMHDKLSLHLPGPSKVLRGPSFGNHGQMPQSVQGVSICMTVLDYFFEQGARITGIRYPREKYI